MNTFLIWISGAAALVGLEALGVIQPPGSNATLGALLIVAAIVAVVIAKTAK